MSATGHIFMVNTEAEPTELLASPDYPWWLCQEELGGTMIEFQNKHCLNGKWFHLRLCGTQSNRHPSRSMILLCRLQEKSPRQRAASNAIVCLLD